MCILSYFQPKINFWADYKYTVSVTGSLLFYYEKAPSFVSLVLNERVFTPALLSCPFDDPFSNQRHELALNGLFATV